MSIEEQIGISVIPRDNPTTKHRPYTVVGSSVVGECVVAWVWATSAAGAKKEADTRLLMTTLAVMHGFVGRADVTE